MDGWKRADPKNKATEGSTAVFSFDKSQNLKFHHGMQLPGWSNSHPPT